MNPRDCRSQVTSIDPGATGTPYRGLGVITLCRDDPWHLTIVIGSLGQAGVATPRSSRACGGRIAYHFAGTTCHVRCPSYHTRRCRMHRPGRGHVQ